MVQLPVQRYWIELSVGRMIAVMMMALSLLIAGIRPGEEEFFYRVFGSTAAILLVLAAVLWQCGEAMSTWLFTHDPTRHDDSDQLMDSQELFRRYVRDKQRYIELRRERGLSITLARGFEATRAAAILVILIAVLLLGLTVPISG